MNYDKIFVLSVLHHEATYLLLQEMIFLHHVSPVKAVTPASSVFCTHTMTVLPGCYLMDLICRTAQVFFLCLLLFSRLPLSLSLSLLLVELMDEKDVLDDEGVNTRIMFVDDEDEEDTDDLSLLETLSP